MKHPAERADTQDLVRARTTLGDFELTVLSDGPYFLDGGAMFGVVPKPMWEKRAPADEFLTGYCWGRIPLWFGPGSIPS